MIAKIEKNFFYAKYTLLGFLSLTILVGLAIVFIWRRENFKPAFIKVIWVLLCLAGFAAIANWVIYIELTKLSKEGNYQRFTDLWPYYDVTGTVVSALVSVAHWIFAA